MKKNSIGITQMTEVSVRAQQAALRRLLGMSAASATGKLWVLHEEPAVLVFAQPFSGGPEVGARVQYVDKDQVAFVTLPRKLYGTRDPHVHSFLDSLDTKMPGIGINTSDDEYTLFGTVTAQAKAVQWAGKIFFSFAADVFTFVDFMVTSMTLRAEPQLASPSFVQFLTNRDLGPEAAVDAIITGNTTRTH